jgi:predicted ester cyclase
LAYNELTYNHTIYALEAFRTGDVRNVSEFMSLQYINHGSQFDPIRGPLRGPAEFIDTVENLRSAFPDLRIQEQETIIQDDVVVSTHTGNFFFLPPAGNKISYELVHLFKVGEGGKIVEHKAIRDDLTLLAQLGALSASSPEYVPFF